MNIEQFQKGKKKIRAGWAEDRIVSEEDTNIILKCENDAYLRYTIIQMPEEMAGTPAYEMMHGKVMFQFSEDLKTYKNVTAEVAERRKAEGRVLEALKELAFRVQIGEVLS